MKSSIQNIFFSLLAWMGSTAAFVPNNINTTGKPTAKKTSSSVKMIPMDDISSIYSASSLISTISADIDNIPTDDFATVFAGGIAVMIGGVFSTVMVGVMLESGNSYASVVADSYAQGGDEEFWESLSPEDQVKTRELLEKMRKSKGGQGQDELDIPLPVAAEAVAPSAAVEAVASKGEKKEVSMFSDYDD